MPRLARQRVLPLRRPRPLAFPARLPLRSHRPSQQGVRTAAAPASAMVAQPAATASQRPPLFVELGDAPGSLGQVLAQLTFREAELVTATQGQAPELQGLAPALRFSLDKQQGEPAFAVTFAAATRFDTIEPAITWADLRQNWASQTITYSAVAVLSDTLPALAQVLGPPGNHVTGYAAMDEVVDAAWQDRTTLAIVPFELLEPTAGSACHRRSESRRERAAFRPCPLSPGGNGLCRRHGPRTGAGCPGQGAVSGPSPRQS